MKTNCIGKKAFMALKLDMSKAYDWVEWIFLEKNLLKMGFSGFLGGFNYGVYMHYFLFYPCKWRAEGFDFTF